MRRWLLLAGYLLLASIAAIQQWSLYRPNDPYTHYNNYIIFKQAYAHLLHGDDIYVQYLAEHWDYFRYSPSFALAFGAFAWMPDVAGLLLWNILNASTLFLAFWTLTAGAFDNQRLRAAAGWFVAIEMVTALQNAQSNVLIAGLIILAFTALEQRRLALAALALVAAAFIKPFALVGFSLCLLSAERKPAIVWGLGWTLAIAGLPLLVLTPAQLVEMYASWWQLLSMDFGDSAGLSVMGWLGSWFQLTPPTAAVDLAGIGLFCWPLALGMVNDKRSRDAGYRLLMLANVLVWVVIFNHKAESSTYIIAMCGVAVWLFAQPQTRANTMLAVLAFILTSLSPTDLFPRSLAARVFDPYAIKAVPCILIWLKITYDLVSGIFEPQVAGALTADRRHASGYN